MVNRPKQIGTAGESAAVRYLRTTGNFPDTRARRLTLSGRFDQGDVFIEFPNGITGIIEVKSGKQADNASLQDIWRWQRETSKERRQARASLGLLLVKRNGYSPERIAYWRCFIRLRHLSSTMLGDSGDFWVEMPFAEAMTVLLNQHGYYEPADAA